MSQDEIGNIVGASRQRISQALHVLEKAGLITVDYRMITVLDLEGCAASETEPPAKLSPVVQS